MIAAIAPDSTNHPYKILQAKTALILQSMFSL